MTPSLRRVLIVRLGALGDIIHALPVAAALRRAQPDTEIDWLVSTRHREILDLATCVNHVIAVNDRGNSPNGRSIVAAIRAMRARRYDLAIDVQGLVKSAVLARLSGARRVVGFERRYLREPLARAFYSQAHDPGGAGLYARAELRHVIRINLGLLTWLGVPVGRPEFPIREVASPVADRMRAEAGGPFVLVNPGAAWPNKRWPPDRFGALARAVYDRTGLRAVVLWGPGERPIAEEVVADSAGAGVLAPQTSLTDLVALSRAATVMVSGDTGPTHVAAAVGTPLVSIYGPTRPNRNGPWAPDDIALTRSDICLCIHIRSCTAPEWCLRDLQVDEVRDAVERRLATSGRAYA